MNPKSPTQFQHGLIDVFKTNKVFELNIVDCVKKGDVVVEMVSPINSSLSRTKKFPEKSSKLAVISALGTT